MAIPVGGNTRQRRPVAQGRSLGQIATEQAQPFVGIGGNVKSGKAVADLTSKGQAITQADRDALLQQELLGQAEITGGTVGGVQLDVPGQKEKEIFATEEARTAGKLKEGQRAAERSMAVISTTLNDFSKVLSGAYDEGGFGDIVKAGTTAFRQKFLGGIGTKGLVETGKIPGKKVEIITKMMPLLTQQGDKPGSVRLVSTVFERLSDSLPGANKRGEMRGNDISLEESRGMMAESIKSMFRFSQAIQSLGIDNNSIEKVKGEIDKDGKAKKGSDLDKVGQMIERVSQQFYPDGSPEAQQLEDFIAQALAPLDARIAQEASGVQASPDSDGEYEEYLKIVEGNNGTN